MEVEIDRKKVGHKGKGECDENVAVRRPSRLRKDILDYK
jgi:hypothetical protein